MPLPVIEVHAWPLVLIRFPESLSVEELDEHFVEMEEKLLDPSRPGAFAVVIEMSATRPREFTAVHRKHAADNFKRLKPKVGDRYTAEAYVMPSALTRAALSAVHWVFKPQWPTKVFATEDEAVRWARATLGETLGAPALS